SRRTTSLPSLTPPRRRDHWRPPRKAGRPLPHGRRWRPPSPRPSPATPRSPPAAPALPPPRLSGLPGTFLHGDWKMGNLGSHPDGRTILLDWTLPGAGPACWDLCWYLALNRARLPEQKETAIARFRAALESHGIATATWWQEQLDLCLIGIMATFGWERALGAAGELPGGEPGVAGAPPRQHIPIPG